MMITQARLKELFRYEPKTGHFIRLLTRSHNASCGDIAGTRRAGDLRTGGGYLQIHIDGRVYLSHRLAFLYMTGEIPPVVDHIDHDRENNKWANLRGLLDHRANDRNVSRKISNRSGVPGVYWDRSRCRWVAEIMTRRRKVFLGRFDDFAAAVAARKNAERTFDFHPNHGVERRAMEDA